MRWCLDDGNNGDVYGGVGHSVDSGVGEGVGGIGECVVVAVLVLLLALLWWGCGVKTD